MTKPIIYDEASEVTAEDGTVAVRGPDHVDVDLTPEAAAETADRLMLGSMKAQGQRYFEAKKAPPKR